MIEVGIPCDLTPPSPDDSPHLILWYKNIFGSPIYRSVHTAYICFVKNTLYFPSPDHNPPQCGSSCRPLCSFSLARSLTGGKILFSHSTFFHKLNSTGLFLYHQRSPFSSPSPSYSSQCKKGWQILFGDLSAVQAELQINATKASDAGPYRWRCNALNCQTQTPVSKKLSSSIFPCRSSFFPSTQT